MRDIRFQGIKSSAVVPTGVFLIAALGASLFGAVNSPTGIPIVLAQVPAGAARGVRLSSGAILPAEGARLLIVYPDGSRRPLADGFLSACDPDVSFDGKRILFAGKKTEQDPWNIFEIAADGQGLRQITRNAGNCRNPLYLSTLYTLISDRPWHQIAFLSDLPGNLDEYGAAPAASLYSCRLDGTGGLRLTFAPSGVVDPFLMADGRLILASMKRRRLEERASLALFGLNIDGTDFALFAAEEGRPFKRMPCVTTDGLAVFVEADRAESDDGGILSCVSLRRNRHSYRAITKSADGKFLFPSPLPNGKVLASRLPGTAGATYGIVELDPASGGFDPVYDDPAFHDVQARILAPREEPDGRSTSVLRRTGEIEDPFALESKGTPRKPEEMPMGKLYCLNIYTRNLIAPEWVTPGVVKRARFLEGIPLRVPGSGDRRKADGESVSDSDVKPAVPQGPLLTRRFLGEAPVEDDGSFNVQVPADVPIEIQLLDGDGLALESCGWIWVKNNEPRGCIGCHENPELVPENRLVQAVAKPSVMLTLPPERRRTVDFVNDVMPIVRSKCIACHNDGGALPRLDGGTLSGGQTADAQAYAALVGRSAGPAASGASGKGYVIAGAARRSPLIWHIFGRNTSQPWDQIPAGTKIRPMPLSGSPLLSEGEIRALIEWIDTGAGWNSRSAPAAPSH